MSSHFVSIAACDTVHEAYLIRSQLESAGIPVVLRNEHLVSSNSIYGLAAGGVEVMVPQACAPDALRFLQAQAPASATADNGDASAASQEANTSSEDVPLCPHCGGRLERRRRLWPSLLSLLLCAASPGQSSFWRCTSCGKKAR